MGCQLSRAEGEEYVISFPQALKRWPAIAKMLTLIQSTSQSDSPFGNDWEYIGHIAKMSQDAANKSFPFHGLKIFLQRVSEADREDYTRRVIPYMAQLVLQFPELKPDWDLTFFRAKEERSVDLDKRFVACLIAMGFFCLYPQQTNNLHVMKWCLNFKTCFAAEDLDSVSDDDSDQTISDCQVEKLKCILNYFKKLMQSDGTALGTVTYQRRRDMNSIKDQIKNSVALLCPFEVKATSELEDPGFASRMVYYVHENVGNDTLDAACREETIKFLACPELLLSLLLMERVQEDEAVVISGFQQFSICRGRGDNFRYDGPWTEPPPATRPTLVAIGAGVPVTTDKQYEQENIDNEIQKAYFAFTELSNTVNAQAGAAVGGAAVGGAAGGGAGVAAVSNDWGCVEAFEGDPQLKMLMCWIAASMAGCPRLTYYIPEATHNYDNAIVAFRNASWTVKKLYRALLDPTYKTFLEQLDQGRRKSSVFDAIFTSALYKPVENLNS